MWWLWYARSNVYSRTLSSLEDNLMMASKGRNMLLSSTAIKYTLIDTVVFDCTPFPICDNSVQLCAFGSHVVTKLWILRFFEPCIVICLRNKSQQDVRFIHYGFNLKIVSSTCFEHPSAHLQEDFYKHFYVIVFMHPYKQYHKTSCTNLPEDEHLDVRNMSKTL